MPLARCPFPRSEGPRRQPSRTRPAGACGITRWSRRRRCHRPPRKSCASYRGSSWRTSWTRVPQTLAQISGECADHTTVEQIADIPMPQLCEATVEVAPITPPDRSSQTADILAQNIPQVCSSQPPERIVDVPVHQRQEKFENVAVCPPQEPGAAPALAVLCETTAQCSNTCL